MSQFLGPDFNTPIAWLADLIAPAFIRSSHNIEDIIIPEEDKEMLRSLARERLLFFTNHPSTAEPMIAYYIANVMGSRFHYMTTRRAFDFLFGAASVLLRGLGCFSVIPGIADKESMKMARNILMEPKGKLVLFPEGEPMCGENDVLMPFQPGIVRLSMSAYDDLQKIDSKADISILSGFIKYKIKATTDHILGDLIHSIQNIENHLGLESGNRNLLRRFLMVGRVLLENGEREYGISFSRDEDYNFRIERLRHRILDKAAQKLRLESYNIEADAIRKLRHLTSVIELIELKYPIQKLPVLNSQELKEIKRDCVRAYDFITIKKDYLVSKPSPERFYEWLQRFESLVLHKNPQAMGGVPSRLPRKAYIYFSKPFWVGEYYKEYKKDKKNGLNLLLFRIEHDMKALLNHSQELTTPIVTPFDVSEYF
ncbi:MAG: 1-acyl-sn-glycerol-3-phosphate acyltransferase [Leptospiraceae bacterium]|nr:1-acyl-sn-glycerol-3-phosphate acyltransferase [Leptospiraceae bacterium]MCP5494399.1 1-acyl-sn-glycerol-3-phosphate acyltransferase [Leptospiraceae bacterium]